MEEEDKGMNHIQLVGRITKDVELKENQKGNKYCCLTLAVRRNRVAKPEEQNTDFIDCMCFGKTAELVAKHKKKGEMLGVVGTLNIDNVKKEDGSQRTYATVVVNTIDLI